MVKYILPVACAVFQLTEQPYKFGVQVMDARVYHGALALLLYGRLNLGGRLGYGVLNSAGMNTSVKNQLFKGHTRYFAANRVKA